ncbi:MAG: hypothetical protein A3J38_04110 [Gammaproteobacteria bacterium RIFCSPHIGHO2_12_FULL_45_9]|nr:MAG: hypothetical protein A3J38_04110 [Gammaproteobacteria bacterium RIFCSPHIGHO2_12_FULL_45_9]
MVMTNIEIAGNTAKEEIATIARQAMGLATGLQSVAPATSASSASVVYLMETAKQLAIVSDQLDEFAPSAENRPEM